MYNLTREEQLTIARYLTEPHSRIDGFLYYTIYFVPSLMFALYGMWKADFVEVVLGYVVLLVLVIYLISYQRRRAPLFRSALQKLVAASEEIAEPAVSPASAAPY